MDKHKLIRSGVPNDTGKLRPTLRHCLEAALSIADTMIDELLDKLAEVADPDHLARLPRELVHVDIAQIVQLTEEAEAVKITWRQYLRHVLFHGESDDPEVHAHVRFDDLRLLDERHIDASIEFAIAEQGLIEATEDLLPRLNALVSNLMGWLTVQPDLNPLRPSAYAWALRAVMLRHVPDPFQRTALFVPVAGILGNSLRQVYRELIQWLMAHGVEPLESPLQSLQSDRGPSNAVGKTLLTLSRLRQLLAGDLNAQGEGGVLFLQTVPASMTVLEDMGLIEPLMQRLRERTQSPSAQPSAELPVVNGQHLGRLLGQEVVRLMLDKLTQDARLLPAIRQQIGLLEPSLIRLSQDDPRFFSDRQHPARQLLEHITQRSLGFQSQSDDGFADLLRSVTAAVRSINRVDVSEEIFARLLRRLRRRWEQDDERKTQRRAEAARALMHAEQRQILAERLAGDMQQRLQDKEVPEFVQRFLCGPWVQALAESQLADSTNPAEGDPLETLADDLIWSVQPALIRRDVDHLARLVPRLLTQMREGLVRIAYPPELTAQFFDALVGLHEKAFETPAVVPSPADAGLAPGGGPDETFWMAGKEAEEAGFVSGDLAPDAVPGVSVVEWDLSTGAWVDLRVQGEWVRAQLTWTSPRGGLFMFISAHGMAHSMTRRTLERLFSTDALRVVSRVGVVEGALDAVAQQALRNTPSAIVDGSSLQRKSS